MKSRLIVLTIFALFLGVSAGCTHRSRDLYQPAPIQVSKNTKDVRGTIRTALKDYQWIIEEDKPGKMVARQMRRSHEARVRITYTGSQVKIVYVDSKNLNYSVDGGGKPHIHGTYNTWVQNIERRIASLAS